MPPGRQKGLKARKTLGCYVRHRVPPRIYRLLTRAAPRRRAAGSGVDQLKRRNLFRRLAGKDARPTRRASWPDAARLERCATSERQTQNVDMSVDAAS